MSPRPAQLRRSHESEPLLDGNRDLLAEQRWRDVVDAPFRLADRVVAEDSPPSAGAMPWNCRERVSLQEHARRRRAFSTEAKLPGQ